MPVTYGFNGDRRLNNTPQRLFARALFRYHHIRPISITSRRV